MCVCVCVCVSVLTVGFRIHFQIYQVVLDQSDATRWLAGKYGQKWLDATSSDLEESKREDFDGW